MVKINLWIRVDDLDNFHECYKQLYLYRDENTFPCAYWLDKPSLQNTKFTMISISLEDYFKIRECK